MTSVTKSASTTASPDVVWSVLADFFAIAEWASAVGHSSPMTATPAGVGASRRAQVGSAVLVEKVRSWEPGVGLAYELIGLPRFVDQAVNEWVLSPGHNGGTDIALTLTITPGSKPPMKAAAKAVANRAGNTNASLVADLVATVEQGTTK